MNKKRLIKILGRMITKSKDKACEDCPENPMKSSFYYEAKAYENVIGFLEFDDIYNKNIDIDEIYENITKFYEQANRRDYEPTEHEREVFGQIVTIVNNMKKWF